MAYCYDTINDQYLLLIIFEITVKLRPVILVDYRKIIKNITKEKPYNSEFYIITPYSNIGNVTASINYNSDIELDIYVGYNIIFVIRDGKIIEGRDHIKNIFRKILYLKKHEILLNLDLSNNTTQYDPIVKKLDYIADKLEAHEAFYNLKLEVEK